MQVGQRLVAEGFQQLQPREFVPVAETQVRHASGARQIEQLSAADPQQTRRLGCPQDLVLFLLLELLQQVRHLLQQAGNAGQSFQINHQMMIGTLCQICHPPQVVYHHAMDSDEQNPFHVEQEELSELDAKASGNLIRQRREKLRLSLAEVVARTTVPSPQYLHKLEQGLVHVGRSKHITSLAKALELTAEDLAALSNRAQRMSMVDVRYPIPFREPIPFSAATIVAGTLGRRGLPDVGAYTLERQPDKVVVVDRTQREPAAGLHYVIVEKTVTEENSKKYGHHARAVSGSDDSIYFVTDECLFSGTEVVIFGRIIFEGRAL